MSTEESVLLDTITNLRLPPFAGDNPRIWFLQIEAAFATRRIKNETTKFCLVVEALPHAVAKLVDDILENIPEDKPYQKLKDAVIKRSGFSESRDLKELFTSVELGDRTPSQLLRHMRSLLNGRKMDDFVLQQLWREKLPSAMQHIIASLPNDSSIDHLADTADRIAESYHPTITALTPQTQQTTSMETTLTSFISEIRKIFSDEAKRRTRFRPRSRSISRNREKLCWYHHKFGNKANKCVQPCNFKRSGDLNHQARQ